MPSAPANTASMRRLSRVTGRGEARRAKVSGSALFVPVGGVCGVAIPMFILASIVGRGGRFFLVAALLYFFGPPIRYGMTAKWFRLNGMEEQADSINQASVALAQIAQAQIQMQLQAIAAPPQPSPQSLPPPGGAVPTTVPPPGMEQQMMGPEMMNGGGQMPPEMMAMMQQGGMPQ